jgi:hypothetical protein
MILNINESSATQMRHQWTAYPCLCLCLGFSQSTLKTPFLLTILHLAQIVFTEGLTFIAHPPHYKKQKARKECCLKLPFFLLEAIRNSSFRQIIG